MNALMLLKSDHKTVEELFKKFEAAGDRNPKAKRKIVDQIIRELSIHAAIEEQVFYPAIRNANHDAEDTVLESLEEHHVVKWLLAELDGMAPESERFDAKVTVLIDSVRHHVKDEEKELFEMARVMGRRRLEELGEQLASAKKGAPTHPHPRAPDVPPGNIVANMGAAALDRARDAGRSLVSRATARRGQAAAGPQLPAKAPSAPRAASAARAPSSSRGQPVSRAKAASPSRPAQRRGRSASSHA